jgi:hypothetical protein
MVFTYNKIKSSHQVQQQYSSTQTTRFRTLNLARGPIGSSQMNSIIHNIGNTCSSCGN